MYYYLSSCAESLTTLTVAMEHSRRVLVGYSWLSSDFTRPRKGFRAIGAMRDVERDTLPVVYLGYVLLKKGSMLFSSTDIAVKAKNHFKSWKPESTLSYNTIVSFDCSVRMTQSHRVQSQLASGALVAGSRPAVRIFWKLLWSHWNSGIEYR